jgi:hypothetical protein
VLKCEFYTNLNPSPTMKFKFILLLPFLIVLCTPLFAQVPCGKLTIDSVYFFDENPQIVFVRITNHDTNTWAPRVIGLIETATNATLVSSAGCGCVVLFGGRTGDFPLNLVKPFTLSEGFSCKTVLNGLPYDGIDCIGTYNVKKSGIPHIANKLKIDLFPNPATTDLSVSLPSGNKSNTKIVIVNVQGQAIYSEVTTSQKANLNISAFKPGVYFVQLYNTDVLVTTSKLIVE